MLDPTGPLPASVYWRRRIVALGGLVLAVSFTAWTVTASLAAIGASPAVPLRAPAPVAPAPNLEPVDCADQSIRVSAEPAKPVFRLGERVGLSMVVTNSGDRTCRRDINRLLRELIVSARDGQRVWSSNDCYTESTNELPVLQPGQTVRNEITWLATNSAPGCPLRRDLAPAGDYSVVARLGPLASQPVPFRLG